MPFTVLVRTFSVGEKQISWMHSMVWRNSRFDFFGFGLETLHLSYGICLSFHVRSRRIGVVRRIEYIRIRTSMFSRLISHSTYSPHSKEELKEADVYL